MKKIEDILNIKLISKINNFKKGDVVQKAFATNSPAIYVKKGLLKSYLIDSKGTEHIYMFASEGYIIGDIEAMKFNQPTRLYINCLEDSQVIFFNKKQLQNDLSKVQLMMFNQMLSRRIGRLQRRVLMLMGSPAIDRYKYFLETYPELPNRIPQKMIASYLGIAPQTLNTIRNKISKGT